MKHDQDEGFTIYCTLCKEPYSYSPPIDSGMAYKQHMVSKHPDSNTTRKLLLIQPIDESEVDEH